MSQEQAPAFSVVVVPAASDVQMSDDTSLLQRNQPLAVQKRREGFPSKSLLNPDLLDEVSVVSTIGRRTK